MPVTYKISPELNVAYMKAWGNVSVDEILTAGVKMFTDTQWENGLNILIDYRDTQEFAIKAEDVKKVVQQDRQNEPLFDKSKCAIVANTDLIFGISRMWEILSEDINIPRMVFRDINDARIWLGLDSSFLDLMNKLS